MHSQKPIYTKKREEKSPRSALIDELNENDKRYSVPALNLLSTKNTTVSFQVNTVRLD
jgi:hypothetical protein